MKPTDLILTLRAVAAIIELSLRAYEAGRDVTHEELYAVFATADAAEADWQQANEEVSHDG